MINQLKTFALASLFAASAFAQFSTPVRDIDNAGRNAFSIRINCVAATDSNASCPTPNVLVPAGYRFAVTQISIFTTAPAGLTFNYNISPNNLTGVSHAFPTTYSTAAGSVRGSHNVFFFMNSENTFVHLMRQVAVSGEPNFLPGSIHLSGYLVKL